MITDEKRREIAGNLRYCAEMCGDAGVGVLDSDVLNALGIHCGDTDGTSDAYDVEKLADLIDRPTCHLVEDEDGRTACSECGCTALCLLDATYCPDCGSIIERPR